MKTNSLPTATFRTELTKNIIAKIKVMKKDGTTAMGLANLKMVVNPPSMYSPGAPPCPGSYARMFRDIALSTPAIRRFLITTDY